MNEPVMDSFYGVTLFSVVLYSGETFVWSVMNLSDFRSFYFFRSPLVNRTADGSSTVVPLEGLEEVPDG